MKKAFIIFALIALLFILFSLFCPYPIFHHGVLKNLDSLLNSDFPKEQLPEQFYITLGDVTASFSKGSPAFTEVVSVLQSSRSNDVRIAAGPQPSFEHNRFGKVTIPYWFIQFRFPLNRSSVNTNYLWIGFPKRTSSGTTWPTIIDDGLLTRLVQENRLSDNQ